MKLLDEKAGQCATELDTIGKAARFCQDFQDYSDYLFKGSAKTYMQYHISNGDFRNENAPYVMIVLKKALATLSRLAGP